MVVGVAELDRICERIEAAVIPDHKQEFTLPLPEDAERRQGFHQPLLFVVGILIQAALSGLWLFETFYSRHGVGFYEAVLG